MPKRVRKWKIEVEIIDELISGTHLFCTKQEVKSFIAVGLDKYFILKNLKIRRIK